VVGRPLWVNPGISTVSMDYSCQIVLVDLESSEPELNAHQIAQDNEKP
jgi:hypothetical protein